MKLTIIGNGFDLHHDIPSGYYDFKDYVDETDPSLSDLISKYFDAEDFWNDFESALAHFDTDHAIDEASNFLMPYSAEDWSDSYHHSYQYELDEIVKALTSKLHGLFCIWIRSLKIPLKKSFNGNYVNVNTSSLFLTFNYTTTLDKLYSIPPIQIIYIHGNVHSSDSDIILGHDWSPAEKRSLNDERVDENTDTRIIEGNQIIDSYFKKTFKPTLGIINANKVFFSSLKNMTSIDVMGHSLGSVDIPYFKKIISNLSTPYIQWRISYYLDQELENHKKAIRDIGIPEHCVSFLRLNEF